MRSVYCQRCLRNVEKHVFLAFAAGGGLDESRASALDLNTTSSFLLNVLDIGSSVSNDLGSQVEPRDRLELDWDLGFGPFALCTVSIRLVLSFGSLGILTLPSSSRST